MFTERHLEDKDEGADQEGPRSRHDAQHVQVCEHHKRAHEDRRREQVALRRREDRRQLVRQLLPE